MCVCAVGMSDPQRQEAEVQLLSSIYMDDFTFLSETNEVFEVRNEQGLCV